MRLTIGEAILGEVRKDAASFPPGSFILLFLSQNSEVEGRSLGAVLEMGAMAERKSTDYILFTLDNGTVAYLDNHLADQDGELVRGAIKNNNEEFEVIVLSLHKGGE